MPVQILPQKTHLGSQLGQALGQGFNQGAQQGIAQYQQQQQQEQQSSMLKNALTEAQKIYANPNLTPEQKQIGLYQTLSARPEVAQSLSKQMNELQSSQAQATKIANQGQNNKQIIRDIEERRNLPPGSLAAYENDPKMAEQLTRPAKEKAPLGGLSGTPVTPEESSKIENVLKNNPNASAEELETAFNKEQIPPARTKEILESRRRSEETKSKRQYERENQALKETAGIRKDYADKGNNARQSIQNKNQLLEIVNTGNINDPSFAIIAEALPLNLGKRLLSNESVEYKAGIIDEFKDLRNIFSGATRVVEIEKMEDKIANLYLTDEQKKTILKSRINAAQADVIKADAAAEVEDKYPYLGVSKFNEKVNEISKPKLDNLFNKILDEQKAVLKDAELKKKIPLNPQDPEDYNILKQILIEAGGDKEKAKKLAKSKGYKF
jgi:hypothetical protein